MGAGLWMILVIVFLVVAYLLYGRWIAYSMGVDENRRTPVARRKGPRSAGAHWASLLTSQTLSIMGLGTLQATLASTLFGFVPALVWLVLSGLWFGCAQQLSVLLATVRSGGRGLGSLLEKQLSGRGRYVLVVAAWIMLLLMFGMLVDVTSRNLGAEPVSVQVKDYLTDPAAYQAAQAQDANTNIYEYLDEARYQEAQLQSEQIAKGNGQAGTGLLVVLVLAPLLGALCYFREKLSLLWVGLFAVLSFVGIFFLGRLQLGIPREIWRYILVAYVLVCAIVPLKLNSLPRDLLGAIVTALTLVAAMVGFIIQNPAVEMPAVRGWQVDGQTLMPALFSMMACGAISGVHGLMQAQGAAQLLENEKHAKTITVGGMCIAVLVGAFFILVGASVWVPQAPTVGSYTFSQWSLSGLAGAIMRLGVPSEWAHLLMQLALIFCSVAAMDTAARIARAMFQWLFGENRGSPLGRLLSSRWLAGLVTCAVGLVLSISGYQSLWGIVPIISLTVAASSLWQGTVWLYNNRRRSGLVLFPAILTSVFSLWLVVGTLWPVVSRLLSGESIAPGTIVHSVILLALVALLVYMVTVSIQAMRRRDHSAVEAEG